MKSIAIVLLLTISSSALAYMQLISCRYEYNNDMNASVYVGTYRATSGAIYTYYFPASRGWCPYSV